MGSRNREHCVHVFPNNLSLYHLRFESCIYLCVSFLSFLMTDWTGNLIAFLAPFIILSLIIIHDHSWKNSFPAEINCGWRKKGEKKIQCWRIIQQNENEYNSKTIVIVFNYARILPFKI